MKTEVTQLNAWKRKMDVEVPAEEFKPQEEKTVIEFQKQVHLAGFRKGKVPLPLVRQRFGNILKDDVSEKLAIHFLRKALEEKNVYPIATPMIQKIEYNEGISLGFSAEMEVEPEVQVKDYRGLKIEKEFYKITEEDVKNNIQALREEHATQKAVEIGAAEGHIVEGDIQALETTGIPIIGQKWENRRIELGITHFGKQVQDQLLGVKSGEERRFRVLEAEQGVDGKMREQEKHYSIKIKSVSEKVLPELADEFAKKVGDFESVSKMEEGVQKYLETRRDEETNKSLEDRISAEIIRKNDFELPPSMIQNGLDVLYDDYVRRSERKADPEEFRKTYLPLVQRSIKWEILWHKIAEVESLVIHEADIEQWIQKYVESSPKEEKRIRATFKDPKKRNGLKDRLLNEKVVGFLKEHAKIKEVTVKHPSRTSSLLITP